MYQLSLYFFFTAQCIRKNLLSVAGNMSKTHFFVVRGGAVMFIILIQIWTLVGGFVEVYSLFQGPCHAVVLSLLGVPR